MPTTSYRDQLEEITQKLNVEDEVTASLLDLANHLLELTEQQSTLITRDIRDYMLDSGIPPSYLKVVK